MNFKGYRGECASAIHMRSMLQASRGRWGIFWVWWRLLRLPLVNKMSIISCRFVSHRIGSPNRITAVRGSICAKHVFLRNQTSEKLSRYKRQHILTFNFWKVGNRIGLQWKKGKLTCTLKMFSIYCIKVLISAKDFKISLAVWVSCCDPPCPAMGMIPSAYQYW